jgi:hypothetical protein
MNIESHGVVYFLPKNKGEVNNIYFDRANLIIKEAPKTLDNIKMFKKKYEMECNKKFLNCGY